MKSVKELKNVPDEKIENDLIRIFQIISFENNSFKYLEEEETKENERTNCETKRSKYEEILTKTSRTSRKK